MSPIQSHRFEGCFLGREDWWKSHDGDINEDRIDWNRAYYFVKLRIWMAKTVLSFIMTNNDLVFTEQMLLCLEKVRALGVEWLLETGDLRIMLR